MTRSLADHLHFQARLRPNALAVFGPAGPISFQALVRDVDGLATELLERGLTAHDTVGIHLDFSYLHVLAILALDRLSIPSMSFATAAAATAPTHLPPQYGVTAIVSTHAAPAPPPCCWIALADPHRPRIGKPDAARLAAIGQPADRVLRITWSSGTTGKPRGSPMTRAVQDLRLAIPRLARGLGPATRFLLGMPLSSSYGYNMALAVLAAGGAVVLTPPSSDPVSLANALRVTTTGGTPAMLADLLARGGGSTRRFETITAFDVAGAVLPSQLAREARAQLTPNLVSNYGATECGWAAIGDAAVCIAQPGAVGSVLPWVDLQIVDADDRPVPAGQEGVVRVRGPQVVTRYHDDDATSARVFRDGWFYPGDLGVLSAERLLCITGRVDETIRLGDQWVSPLALEEAVRALPGVRDIAVFGLAEPGGAERVCAAVVLDAGTRPETIRADAIARLGDRAPTWWLVVDRLPRSPHGKVLRRELAELARRQTTDRMAP